MVATCSRVTCVGVAPFFHLQPAACGSRMTLAQAWPCYNHTFSIQLLTVSQSRKKPAGNAFPLFSAFGKTTSEGAPMAIQHVHLYFGAVGSFDPVNYFRNTQIQGSRGEFPQGGDMSAVASAQTAMAA